MILKSVPIRTLAALNLVRVSGVLAVYAAAGLAQSPGTFTPAGNMITPRVGHTATLLTNGKVLIAGGAPALASAEIYDPATGAFTPTSDMTTGRGYHTATLLPDGKVLIVGGCANLTSTTDCFPALDSAELYDPVAGTFNPTGNMMAGRVGSTATLLANGKVLIVGGTNNPSTGALVAPPAEVYDPANAMFWRTLPMNVTREYHTATLLANGKVLIAGGVDAGDNPIGEAELYDPDTNAFTSTGGTTEGADSVQEATLLADGTVFGLKHVENLGSLGDTAVRYDPSTGAFFAAGNRATLLLPVTTLLSDGTVLLTAPTPGVWYSPVYTHTADVYDPVTRSFSITGDMNISRSGHTATLLLDGTVLICGGAQTLTASPWIMPLASAEIYHPANPKAAPILYSVAGSAQGAILHAGSGDLASPSHPAAPGEIIEIFGAGLLDKGVVPPEVSIGGRSADVLWFGDAPGYPSLNQINIRVPDSVAPADAVPIRLNYLGRSSNGVTIAVQ